MSFTVPMKRDTYLICVKGVACSSLNFQNSKSDAGELAAVRFRLLRASVKVSPMSKLSLDRILQSQGFGTRKYCRALIEDGEVAIAGAPHTDYKTTFDTEELVLTIFDEEW